MYHLASFMKPIYFVTQNNYKFQKFQEAVSEPTFFFEQLPITTPEIQAENNRLVAEYSAQWAANSQGKSVICEDIGLYINAYGGFPGPYLSQVENWLKTTGFLTIMANIEDRSAYWEYAVAYCQPGKQPVSFYTLHTGSIAFEARGDDGWYADKIFIPDGQKKTIAELLDAKEYQRNRDHYEKLVEYLKLSSAE